MGNMIRIDGVEYDGPLSWEDAEGDDRIWRVRIRPKPEQPNQVDNVKVWKSKEDSIFGVRSDTQKVTASLERDIKLLQDNQGAQARGLLAVEDRVDAVERDLDNMRMWVARVAVQTSKNATQVNRCIDKLPSFSIDGEGRAIVRLEVIKD